MRTVPRPVSLSAQASPETPDFHLQSLRITHRPKVETESKLPACIHAWIQLIVLRKCNRQRSKLRFTTRLAAEPRRSILRRRPSKHVKDNGLKRTSAQALSVFNPPRRRMSVRKSSAFIGMFVSRRKRSYYSSSEVMCCEVMVVM